jgi:hypothetical protein
MDFILASKNSEISSQFTGMVDRGRMILSGQ